MLIVYIILSYRTCQVSASLHFLFSSFSCSYAIISVNLPHSPIPTLRKSGRFIMSAPFHVIQVCPSREFPNNDAAQNLIPVVHTHTCSPAPTLQHLLKTVNELQSDASSFLTKHLNSCEKQGSFENVSN